jgi:tetratricopeptide (TPR) repeat protein
MLSALKKGDLSEAALLLERLQQEDPLSVSTRGLELEYLLRCERLREASSLAEQLLRLFPSSPRIHYLAGRVAYRRKEYRQATECFRESLRIRPGWQSSWYLAKALTQLAEFDEAALLLEALLPDHPECYQDLAWLCERQEKPEAALAALENYLRAFPQSEWAKAQQVRLRARIMDPQELVNETRSVMEFGEELAESLVPQFLEALFRTGQLAQARQFLAERGRSLSTQGAASSGWTCYRYQAFDLAMDLFVPAFAAQRGNVKFLSAIEFAAARSGRLPELIRLYETHAGDDRRLFGRLRNLKRRAGLSQQ